MTKIFTKADIEFEHFLEVLKPADAKDVQLEETQVKELYAHLEDLKSQGIYVVDVTLVSTRSYDSYYSDRTHNQYMIRFVRPKHEVKLLVELYNSLTEEYDYYRSKVLGFFKTAEEVEEIKKKYLDNDVHDVKYTVDVTLHSPLDDEL